MRLAVVGTRAATRPTAHSAHSSTAATVWIGRARVRPGAARRGAHRDRQQQPRHAGHPEHGPVHPGRLADSTIDSPPWGTRALRCGERTEGVARCRSMVRRAWPRQWGACPTPMAALPRTSCSSSSRTCRPSRRCPAARRPSGSWPTGSSGCAASPSTRTATSGSTSTASTRWPRWCSTSTTTRSGACARSSPRPSAGGARSSGRWWGRSPWAWRSPAAGRRRRWRSTWPCGPCASTCGPCGSGWPTRCRAARRSS